ncbi:uncharacterized protein DUF262 [Paraburkholderia sp. BL23I1N1]|uniref:DUF262 domain-containing protein n=1 Tax=Paraburkholderia sp. BL23I1N1 TaxID=1938802 RepID=UPI000E70F225|nr:DUF262 domain-containing protein [Paraburkholderia sp. BL23I1N1]RKE23944.1 uncharacterized protein DUF262 [Paraburkholderia sp. BL23I1N1]
MKTVTKTVFKVGDFVSWAQAGNLDLQPIFQRRPVWKAGAKSYLIDTVIRGLPIPIVFLRDRLALQSIITTREVVDGQQRLRTILSFINSSLVQDYSVEQDEFKLSKLHNEEFGGMSFSELPPDTQRAIVGYEIPVHIFSADTEDRDILQIFARLNATGVKLNDQELRNAGYFGAFKALTYNIGYENLNRWQDWGIFKLSDISRMNEVEEVADLIVSMHQGVHGRNKKLLDEYYETYDDAYPERAAVQKRFEVVMSSIEDVLGGAIGTSEFSRRALFNDLFVATYELMYGLGSPLTVSTKATKLPAGYAKKILGLSKLLSEGELPEEVDRSLRGATSDKGSRLKRVNFILGPFGYELQES